MRVLIVGCGYVGVPLGAELVRLGHEVFGLRRNPAAEGELKAVGIQPLTGDMTQPETLAKLPRDFDWVVSCVAAGGDADSYRQIYLQGTRNLIDWLAPNPPKNLFTPAAPVFTGRTTARRSRNPALPNRSRKRPKFSSRRKKFCSMRRRKENFPPSFCVWRGFTGRSAGIGSNNFCKDAAQIEGDGARLMNMIHRDDLVGCIIAALKSGRAGEIYNAADDEPVSLLHFFQWLAQAVDKPMPPVKQENSDDIRKRGVTNKRVSNRKLKMELGYRFKYPTFRQGYSAELLRLDRAGK